MDLRDCQRLAGLQARIQVDFRDPLQTVDRLAEVLREMEQARARQPQKLGAIRAGLSELVLQAAELANNHGLDLAECVEDRRRDFLAQHTALSEIDQIPVIPERIERVTVYAASSPLAPESFLQAAAELGRRLALQGWAVVYGGGNLGLMGALSDGVRAEHGRLIAVILDRFIARQASREEVTDMKAVSTMRSRKRGLEEAGDAFVCLPGGLGTLEEIFETLSFRHLGFHQKPIVFCNFEGFWDDALRQMDRCFAARLIPESSRSGYQVAATPAEAVEMLRAWERPAAVAPSEAPELRQRR